VFFLLIVKERRMQTLEDIFKGPPRPLENVQYYKERENSVNYQPDNTLFTSFQQTDYSSVNFDAEQSFRSNENNLKKGLRPWSGQLPYRSTKSFVNPGTRMIPESTRSSRVCFNDALANSGPWYLRQWPIWDHLPFLPSVGDVTKDPRYAVQTKGFTTEYRRI
jgi:hypothetical protein